VVRVRESRGTAEFVHLRGAAVGVLPAEQFASVLQEVELRLEPGDLVLAYSDGVNETHDRAGSLFGESRLQDFAAAHATLGPEEFLKRLHATLEQFSDGFGQFDDITALALKAAVARSTASPPEFAGTEPDSAGTPEPVAAAGAVRAGGREDRAGRSVANPSAALCETGARS
jgi:stage II sporulation SpoE-like protein